jgi:hypothetical protein
VVNCKAIDDIFAVDVDDNDLFAKLKESWETACPKESRRWYDVLVRQICSCAARTYFPLKVESMRGAMSTRAWAPVVNRTLTYHDDAVEFDIQFYHVVPRSTVSEMSW